MAPRRIADLRLGSADFRSKSKPSMQDRSIVSSFNPKFEIRNPKSFDYPIRPHQHVRRNRQADLLGRFQIDDELELLRLFDWQVRWLSSFQYLVDIYCSAPIQVGQVDTVRHKPAGKHIVGQFVNHGEPEFGRERSHFWAI